MYISADDGFDTKLFPGFSFVLTSNIGQVITKPFNTDIATAYAVVICAPQYKHRHDGESWVWFCVNNKADPKLQVVNQLVLSFQIVADSGQPIFGKPLITGAFNYMRLMVVSFNHKREFKMMFISQKDVKPMVDYSGWPKAVRDKYDDWVRKTSGDYQDEGGIAHLISPTCLFETDCYDNNYPPDKPDPPDPGPDPDPDDPDTIFGMSKAMFLIVSIILIVVLMYKTSNYEKK
jgi:hypothetical protein